MARDYRLRAISEARLFEELMSERKALLGKLTGNPDFDRLVIVERSLSRLTQSPGLGLIISPDEKEGFWGRWKMSRRNCEKCEGENTVVRRVSSHGDSFHGDEIQILFEACLGCDYVYTSPLPER